MGILWDCIGNETERFVVEKLVGMSLGMKMGMKIGLSADLENGVRKYFISVLESVIFLMVKIFKMEGIDSYNWLKSERENRLKSTKIGVLGQK
jgi:hypothetical protein